MPKKKSPVPTPEEFLADYPLELVELAQCLRTIIRQTVPNVLERVYPGWRLIGYRVTVEKKDVYFGFIAPSHERLLLGFEWGILAHDPAGLLQGDGKQVRYVPVAGTENIREPEFRALIVEAIRVAALPRDKKVDLLHERDLFR